MSNNSMQIIPDRIEPKVLIIRKYGNQRNFAEVHKITWKNHLKKITALKKIKSITG